MANKHKIETPGGSNESSEQLTTVESNFDDIQRKATNIVDAIALNKAILDDENALDDEKELAQLKINALLKAQSEIDSILSDAQTALAAIKTQAQVKAATVKKTDMSNITLSKKETRPVSSPHVQLTDAGYVIKPRGDLGVKE